MKDAPAHASLFLQGASIHSNGVVYVGEKNDVWTTAAVSGTPSQDPFAAHI